MLFVPFAVSYLVTKSWIDAGKDAYRIAVENAVLDAAKMTLFFTPPHTSA